MYIREAIASDLPTIIEIYNASIPGRLATADLEPVSVESRLEWFNNHSSHKRPLWILEIDSQIAGWLSLRSFYGRPAYEQTAEISICVSPAWQGKGVGKELLKNLIIFSPKLGLSTLLAFIFAHNYPSLNLFRKYDFEQWGYLPQVAELDNIKSDLIILGRHIVRV